MNIPVFYSFARSGGTLVNKCLGSHPDNLVLSEVNPSGAFVSIARQASEWLGLLAPDELFVFEQMSYCEKILKLHQRAREKGGKLIIRDWPTANFLSRGVYAASMVLEQKIYLNRNGMKQSAAVMTRRTAAVYQSIRRVFKIFSDLSIDEFGAGYLAYARCVQTYPIFHMETFRAQPEIEMRKLCEALGATYPKDFLDSFFKYDRCTGDNTLSVESSLAHTRSIVNVSETQSDDWNTAAEHPLCIEADRILGYD